MGKEVVSSEQTTVKLHHENNPGCMWGILHVLNYHHWRVKKVLPHKKRHWGRRRDKYKRKNIFYKHGIREEQQFGDAEAESLLSSDKHVHCKSCSTMDAMDCSRQNYAIPAQKNHKTTEEAMHNQKFKEEGKFKENTDVFELVRVEKDLLLKFLRDLDVGRKSFLQASNTTARLTKSESFPLATSSQRRKISTSTLKHKQNEIWAFPKGEKLVADNQTTKMFGSSFAKDLSCMKPEPDYNVDSAMKQNMGFSSNSSQGMNNKGWNQLVVHRFKVIKQKIKHAVMELTKHGDQASVAAIHHRASSKYRLSNNDKKMSESLEDGITGEYTESRSSDETTDFSNDSKKPAVQLMRRTSSLNESLDRYTQLFEQSFGKNIKWHNSKSESLKLTNEDKNHISGSAPKLTRRNLSLPNLESIGFFLHTAFSDTNDVVLPGRTSVDSNTNAETDIVVARRSVSLLVKKDKPLDPIMEAEIPETSNGGDNKDDEAIATEHMEDTEELAAGDASFHQEREDIGKTVYPNKDPISVLEASSEDNATNLAEGTDMTIREIESPKSGSIYSLPGSLDNKDVSSTEDKDKDCDDYFLHFEADIENDSSFKYVKEVLELSGFLQIGHVQMCYTEDQPLKPSLFKDLEASLLQEMKCSGEEISYSTDHQLLFDLVNEVLLEIYERSSTYFPRPFSFNCSLLPMPEGHNLLKQVWSKVDSYLSLRPELDQTLDDVVGRDLAKRSGWMNLQWEEEHVALELEDLIMEDLFDDIICS